MPNLTLLNYIPNLFSNPIANAVTLTAVPGIFYILATYSNALFQGTTFMITLMMSVLFTIIQYVCRIPLIEYSTTVAGMSYGVQQIVWILLTLMLSFGSDYILPKYSYDSNNLLDSLAKTT